jgi:hypothetical protein
MRLANGPREVRALSARFEVRLDSIAYRIAKAQLSGLRQPHPKHRSRLIRVHVDRPAMRGDDSLGDV